MPVNRAAAHARVRRDEYRIDGQSSTERLASKGIGEKQAVPSRASKINNSVTDTIRRRPRLDGLLSLYVLLDVAQGVAMRMLAIRLQFRTCLAGSQKQCISQVTAPPTPRAQRIQVPSSFRSIAQYLFLLGSPSPTMLNVLRAQNRNGLGVMSQV